MQGAFSGSQRGKSCSSCLRLSSCIGQSHFLIAKQALHLGISGRRPLRDNKAIEAIPNQPKKKKKSSPLSVSTSLLPGPSPGFTLFEHPRLSSVVLEPRPGSRVKASCSTEPLSLEGAGKEAETAPSRVPGTELGALYMSSHHPSSPVGQVLFFSSFYRLGYRGTEGLSSVPEVTKCDNRGVNSSVLHSNTLLGRSTFI